MKKEYKLNSFIFYIWLFVYFLSGFKLFLMVFLNVVGFWGMMSSFKCKLCNLMVKMFILFILIFSVDGFMMRKSVCINVDFSFFVFLIIFVFSFFLNVYVIFFNISGMCGVYLI